MSIPSITINVEMAEGGKGARSSIVSIISLEKYIFCRLYVDYVDSAVKMTNLP